MVRYMDSLVGISVQHLVRWCGKLDGRKLTVKGRLKYVVGFEHMSSDLLR